MIDYDQTNSVFPGLVVFWKYNYHAKDCLDREGGPCTCGLDEVLEDEDLEEARYIHAEEAREDAQYQLDPEDYE